jgi:flagellar biosynthesis anti-sigma factor FlgM
MANSIVSVGGTSPNTQTDILEVSRAPQQGVQSSSQSSNDAVAPSEVGDATELSGLGNFIATAAKRASGQSSMRSDLVASLKAQIAAGTYHPDPNEVAARVAAAIR